MSNTATPSGLAIARDGMKFTFTWKIADKDHDSGQQFQYRTNNTKAGKWLSVNVGARATSKSVTFTISDFYPTGRKKLNKISFRIRGKRKPYTTGSGSNQKTITPNWSAWARKDLTLLIPAAPTVSAELIETNQTRFTWNLKNDTKGRRPFTNMEWQTILVKECNEKDGSVLTWDSTSLGWATGTGSNTGNTVRTEDTTILALNSYTRWFRVRSRGTVGASAWRYAKHVYAYPKEPIISEVGSSISNGNTVVNLVWTAPSDQAHPIDLTTVEYKIDTPGAGLACPAGDDWDEATTQKDTSDTDGARVVVPSVAGEDECLWVRVRNTHDSNSTASEEKLVRCGYLPVPNNFSAVVGNQYTVAITAEHQSDVPDSRIAVVYRTDEENSKELIIGIIEHSRTSITVQCPAWETTTKKAFGVFEFQGDAVAVTKDGVTEYSLDANMVSDTVWDGGDVPLEPQNVTATISADTEGEVIVAWDWSWDEADSAEISWSRNANAWESTDEPQTYTVSKINAARWRVSDLETGVRWYFRVRLGNSAGEEMVYGPYSQVVEVDLTSAPSIPELTLSKAVITAGETFTANWAYSTTDGTAQAYAEICEAEVSGSGITYGDVIAHETTAQHVDITPDWETGSIHYLCVRVTSASGHVSDGWSAPVSIMVAEPISCEITATSLVEQTLIDEDEDTRTVTSLTELPLTATVTGAGTSGITTLIIERADEYHMIRPDGSTADGYDGETIVLIRQDGEGQISVDQDDLLGLLDDGAPYRLIATVEDGLGQSAEDSIDFEVHWTHQADIPGASVEIRDDAAIITLTAPAGFAEGDVCDIYRLSADKPELIVENGDFNTVYVDPFPAIGEYAGHRVVHRTANGDYITEDGTPAWIDITADEGDLVEEYSIIIDFDGRQIILPYDVSLQNRWAKDFKITNYLGGAQQGDWNINTQRTATYTANLIADDDADAIRDMRALAAYSGICHIRTPEGSSYAADIQVSETKNYNDWDTVGFSLTVTRVDPEELDGLTYEQWVNT